MWHWHSFNVSKIFDIDNSNVYIDDEGHSTCLRPTLDTDRPIAMYGIHDEVDTGDLIEAKNKVNQDLFDE